MRIAEYNIVLDRSLLAFHLCIILGDLQHQVLHFNYDRKKPVASCPGLVNYLQKHRQIPGGIIHTVLDFSAYSDEPIRNIIPYLVLSNATTAPGSNGTPAVIRRPLYVFMSSDSVYEVCADKLHTGAHVESDAVRPPASQDRHQLATTDDYGDGKMRGEEYLQEQQAACGEAGMDYVVLRLADVIGPRDTTERWWQCQLYLHVATALREPVFIPKQLDGRRLSFAYVNDIAAIIQHLICLPDGELQTVVNDSYNIGCVDTITIQGLYEAIQRLLFRGETTFRYTKNSECVPQLYPSVERGPIDVTKACVKLHLNELATPLMQAISDTVQFYDTVVVKDAFRQERKEVYESMVDDFGSLYDTRKLKKILKSTLHLDL